MILCNVYSYKSPNIWTIKFKRKKRIYQRSSFYFFLWKHLLQICNMQKLRIEYPEHCCTLCCTVSIREYRANWSYNSTLQHYSWKNVEQSKVNVIMLSWFSGQANVGGRWFRFTVNAAAIWNLYWNWLEITIIHFAAIEYLNEITIKGINTKLYQSRIKMTK